MNKEKEKMRKVYAKLEEKSLKDLLEIASNYEVLENDLFDRTFKLKLIENLLKLVFLNKKNLKQKLIDEFGGEDEI